MTAQPQTRPASPFFSSGPCAKRPGWSLDGLKDAALARSHRSGIGKKKLKEAIDRSHALLGAPADWKTGIVPASDTGAYEMAMWTMLGARKVDMLAWESFGEGWVTDAVKQLKLEDCRVIKAPYGEAIPFAQVDFDRDVCFTWNGTTSGVKTPNGDWIPADRKGLTICDATSAAFAMDLPWDKLDVVTWSWQKALGGEAAHGMLMLSPRAVERLESYTPPWPLPKVFRLTKGGKLIDGIFKGETINTPSMLCVEDVIDALKWAESIGGLPALMKRAQDSLAALEAWAEKTDWVDFLAQDKALRSETSVCLTIVDPAVAGLPEDAQKAFAKDMSKRLEDAGVAFDVNGYRDAPAGLRIWCGATVEPSDVAALTGWLDWAYAEAKTGLAQAA